jgi:hypothetical protein
VKELLQQLAANIDPEAIGIPKNDPNAVLSGGLNAVYFVAGAACVIVIVVAGMLYTLSAGDSNQIKIAKNAIIYAVAGLAVILMAFTITAFIIGRGA